MKQAKMKTMAFALGSALMLGSGALVHAQTSTPPNQGSQEKSGSAGQYVDDATITTRVKSRFASDDTVSASRIKVETVKGTVELSGNVASEAERTQAVKIAKAVPDVKGVRNNLTIQGQASTRLPKQDSMP